MSKLLSVCMIVKNEEGNLKHTLPPLIAGADEVIIVDTGSTDKTIQAAKELGAKVYVGFPWKDDFSAARNESLQYATGQWVLWVDADEYISIESLKDLKRILKESSEKAYALKICDTRFGETKTDLFYQRVKVFRNFLGIHFERPINEQLFDNEGKLVCGKTLDLAIFHWGGKEAVSGEVNQAKKMRNLKILEKALEENQTDNYYRFLLGNNYRDLEMYELAINAYDQITEKGDKNILIASFLQKARCYFILRRYEKASASAEEAVRLDPENAEALVLLGSSYLALGRLSEAIDVLLKAVKLSPPQIIGIPVDITYYTYKPHFILGQAFMQARDFESALEAFKKAYKIQPNPKVKEKIDLLEKVVVR